MNKLGLDDTLTLLADKTILLSLMADPSEISHLFDVREQLDLLIATDPESLKARKIFNLCFDCVNAAITRLRH